MLALVLIIRGLGIVPGAMIERELVFASRAQGELGGAIVQALVAIPLAVSGFGVWSLVAGQLAGQSVQTVIFWAVTTPTAVSAPLQLPHPARARAVRTACHGRQHHLPSSTRTSTPPPWGASSSAADVGYYNMAWRLANLPADWDRLHHWPCHVPRLRHPPRRQGCIPSKCSCRTSVEWALFPLPVGVGILIAAQPIVLGLFGQRWEPAVAPLQILAVFGVIRAFSGVTAPAIQAAGKPQLILVLNLLHLGVLCAALFSLTPPFGLNGAATAATLAAAASAVPAYWLALRILHLPLRELIASVERPAVCSVPLGGLPPRSRGLDKKSSPCDAASFPRPLRRRGLRSVGLRARTERASDDRGGLPFPVTDQAERGSLLVVVAPDDEALGFAGVIARARAARRRVRVAVVTNGDDRSGAIAAELLRNAARARWTCRTVRRPACGRETSPRWSFSGCTTASIRRLPMSFCLATRTTASRRSPALNSRGWTTRPASTARMRPEERGQDPDPTKNLKWQAIARYASQLDCQKNGAGSYHSSCGYLRAFAKRTKFFWTLRAASWPAPA